MRKKLLIGILIALSLSACFAGPGIYNIKQESMSLLGIADCTSDINFFVNPASVFHYNQKKKFIISNGVSDRHHKGESLPLIYRPEIYILSQFTGNRIALSIDADVHAVGEPGFEESDYTYDLQRDVEFRFSGSVGFNDIALGMGISGGSSMLQKGVTRFAYESLVGTFERIDESQFFNISLGAFYQMNNMSFGLMADSVLSYFGSEQELSIDKATDYISAGAYWTQSKFAKRGRLNKWVFSAGSELQNIFNDEERTLSLGGEVTLQLMNDYSVSFRTGFSNVFAEQNGFKQTFGIGAKLDKFDIGTYASVSKRDGLMLSVNVSFIN